jgi:hypothetical protein
MLFFFELGLFLLVMVTLALGEFVSRGSALTVWLVATVGSLGGYLLARRPLVRLASAPPSAPTASSPGLPPADPAVASPTPAPPDPAAALDRRWARTLLHYWGRTNLLLLLGAALAGGWYWMTVGGP